MSWNVEFVFYPKFFERFLFYNQILDICWSLLPLRIWQNECLFLTSFFSFQVQVPRENARGRDDKASGVPEGVHGRAAYSSCPNHCSLARLWANSIHHPTRSHQCKHEIGVALLILSMMKAYFDGEGIDEASRLQYWDKSGLELDVYICAVGRAQL